MKQQLLLSLRLLFFVCTIFPSQGQSSCGPTLTAGLQAWLPFEETSGLQVRDASGHSREGQIQAGTGTWLPTSGHDRQGALRLSGTESVIIPYAPTSLTAFTISFWTNPDELSNWNSFVGAQTNTNSSNPWGGFVFHTTADGTVYTGIIDQPNLLVLPKGTMLKQKWQHFVFTFDRGTGTLYKDGKPLGSSTNMPYPQPWKGLIIGGTPITAPCSFNGSIDDLRVYDRAISPLEVQQLAACQTTVSALPPDNPSENRERNWTLERTFDGEGNEVAASKQFLDGLGRATQAQARNAATQQVFATQTVYSSGGQPVLQTLAAPINNQSFNYREGFITAGAKEYNFEKFEGNKGYAPTPVDAVSKGTLGYYFSELNAQESLTPITSYPFNLVEPYEGPLGGTRRAAGPGDELRMGMGREAKGRDFVVRKEFDNYVRLRPNYVSGSPDATLEYQAIKSVSVNADGRESIVVSNKEGQSLITCLSGSQYASLEVSGFFSSEATNPYDINAPVYQDVHIPAAGKQDVTFTMGTASVGGRVLIRNLLTDDTISYAIRAATLGAEPKRVVALEPGFYRLTSVTGTQRYVYQARYGNFSYTYYDDAGRVVATVAPNGLSNVGALTGVGTVNTTLGLMGKWSFNEGGGSVASDGAGNNLTATLVQAPTWSVPAMPGSIPPSPAGGSSLVFNGTNYLRVGDAPALRMGATLSFEAWIYPTANQGGIILNKENEYEMARFPDGQIYCAFYNTNPGWNWVSTGLTAPLNTWSHIAITYNNGVVTPYLNGVQAGQVYRGSGAITYNQGELWIGERQMRGVPFYGAIDEVHIWNTVHPPAQSNLVGKWSFNEGSGNVTSDDSGNKLTATLVQTPAWSTLAAPNGIPPSSGGGSSLVFNGANYLRVGDAPALRVGAFLSFEAWIYPTANQDGIILNKENEYEMARFADGKIYCAFFNTNPGWNWSGTGIMAPLNTWSHIAITYDNGVVTPYLNGVPTGQVYQGSGSIAYNQGEFWIGDRQSFRMPFYGAIDEVRVWNTVHPPNAASSNLAPTFVTRNTYDTSGRLLTTESDDEGRSEYVYAKDGRIRFSQSALQRKSGRFSYSNYDEVGRVVESGEYTPGNITFENHLTATPASTSVLQTSLLEDLTRDGGLTTSGRAQRNQVWYDLSRDVTADATQQDKQLIDLGRTQEFVLGAVTKTQNDNVTTWYSYDELGRVTWVVQDIKGVGVKTLDYKYDFSGNVLEVAYQKGQADAFYHYYGYDAAQRLMTVYTSADGVKQTLQAEYSYYLHGPLKRVQIAGNLQGVDYTYTLQGALKAINHINQTLEPGHDAPARNGVQKDLFALTLDYFSGDYRSKAINVPSLLAGGPTAPTRYDGTIQGAAWRTAASTDLHRVAYTYDEKSQLQNSQYGQWQRPKNSSNYLLNSASTNALQEGNLSYDANGNMQSLRRTDQTSKVTDDFSYVYKPNTNQLAAVHTGSPSGATVLDYDYDDLGQMIRQRDGQDQRYFAYDVMGKTTGVYLMPDHTQPLVEYAYDDRGFRVRQTVYPATGGPSHVTTYVRDVAGNLLALYEQATSTSPAVRSEVPLYGSGRLGTLTHLSNGTDDYRYELTDHLGDARVVFHRPTTTIDVETMELGGVPSRAAFLNDDRYRVPVSGAPSGDFVARLTNSQPIGQELKRVLQVTRGDTITFSALAQWKQDAATGSGATPYVLVGAAAGVNALSQRGPEGQRVYGTNNSNWLSLLAAGLGFTLGQRTPTTLGSTALEGWIKYRVLDAQGNPMLDTQGQEIKGVDYLLGTGKWEYLQTGVRVPQDGILEVMAGTSGIGEAVYFDNLRVEQTGGLILQEQHQYAYGAPLPGLSYTVGNRRYRYGYQGQYAEHDSLTGFESFELRLYNSRIGRWMSYDPQGQFSSPYVSMGNNPVSGVDPDGGFSSSQPFLSFVGNGTGLVKGIGGLAVNWSALTPLLSSAGRAAGRAAPQAVLGGVMAAKNGLNAPNDIHINGLDSNGNSRRIADIKSNLFNATVNTSISVPKSFASPLSYDLRAFEGGVVPNAVIFTLGADFAFVGGMGGSLSYAYFLSGASKDKLYSYNTTNANIGLSLGVSANISLVYATNPSGFDHTSLQGNGVTYTGSVGNVSGSYSVSYNDGKFRFLERNADVSYRAYSGALSIPIKKPYSKFIGLSTAGIATPTLGFSVRGQAASIMIQFSNTGKGKQVHFH
jgi:RHS repeat-associated protein